MTDQISMHSMQSAQEATETPSDDTPKPPQKSLECVRSAETLEAAKPAAPVVPRSVAFKQVIGASVMLLILFWANTSWIFGKIYKQSDYTHRLHVLVADLDGGAIGQSLLDTASHLSGAKGEPTYELITYSDHETSDSVYSRVRTGEVWGAIIANPKSSDNLTAALSPSSNAYNASTALTLVYNEARFRTVEISIVYSAMLGAVAAMTANYQRTHGVAAISGLGSDATGENVAAALQPIGYTVVDIKAFGFSSSMLLNTVMFVFPALSQFFFVMALNGILEGVGAYSTWSLKSNLILRAVLGAVFPCLIGLSWATWVFIWKNGGHLSAGQYFLSWLVIWLYTSINFHVIDGTRSLLDMRWMPFVVFTVIITQVSAVLSPMELASGFYRIEFLLFPLPLTLVHFALFILQGILITIFSDGAVNNLKVNLTVAVLWLPVAAAFGMFGNYTRWRKATAAAAAAH